MLIKTLTAYDLQQLMIRVDRNYFSFDGYVALIDYFDDFDSVEVDPVAISCEFSEDSPLDIWDMYKHLFTDFPEYDEEKYSMNEWVLGLIEELGYYTWSELLDNGNIIYGVF